jgi:hypothetical protein
MRKQSLSCSPPPANLVEESRTGRRYIQSLEQSKLNPPEDDRAVPNWLSEILTFPGSKPDLSKLDLRRSIKPNQTGKVKLKYTKTISTMAKAKAQLLFLK